jgi:hypothetical protein
MTCSPDNLYRDTMTLINSVMAIARNAQQALYLDCKNTRHTRRSFLSGHFTNKTPAALTGGE